MIHATFTDGSSMLFDPSEWVYVCEEVWAGEYIAGEKYGYASEVIKAGVYVLEKVDGEGAIPSEAKIQSVREL